MSSNPPLSKKQMMMMMDIDPPHDEISSSLSSSFTDPLLVGLKDIEEVEQLLRSSASSSSRSGAREVMVNATAEGGSSTRTSFDESVLGL